jgi:hypothetical protein
MTAVVDVPVFQGAAATRRDARDEGTLAVRTTYWGYRIHGRRTSVRLVGLQAVCWALGVAMVAVAIGIWVAPQAAGSVGVISFKLGASVLFASLSALLLWHSSRGTILAVEVDHRLGEVREVLCNRAGRATVLSRYGFDAVAGIMTQETAAGRAMLALRLRDTDEVLLVAEGSAQALDGLAERIAQDLMLPRGAPTEPVALDRAA